MKNTFISVRLQFLVVLIGLILLGCTNNLTDQKTAKTKLLVATAANAQFAVEAIKEAFEAAQDSIELEVIVSSSGKLTAQITQGAPYDLLLAANMKYPNYLYENDFAASRPKVYAQGALVLWSNTQTLDTINWQARLMEAVKVAIPNPELAPYGEGAMHFFEHNNLRESVQEKLVFGESIAQTNQYILSGACELGVTAKSVVISPEMQAQGSWVALNIDAYQPIKQGVVITKYGISNHSDASNIFYNYLFSKAAQDILINYGYLTAVQ